MDTTLTRDPASPAAGLVSLDGRPYPLESAGLETRAEGGMALTTLRQRFANPHAEPLEVLYTLPLPADGAVLGYVVHVGERRIVGEVRSREEARAAYEEALHTGRTAGLLEEDRADTFQQRLGNIPVQTAVEVEIRVLQPLAFLREAGEGGGPAEWEYRFPSTVGVRYMGAPGRVKDAGRLQPDRAADGLPTRLELDLRIADEAPPAAVRSPSHALRCEAEGDGHGDAAPGRGETAVLCVSLAEPSPLDRDVVVRWPAAGPEAVPRDEVEVRVVEGGGLEGDDGRYALLTVTPPGRGGTTLRRDLTLLLDASGSMHGLPLTLAKRVVARVLEDLDAGDRFELLSFSSTVSRLTEGLVDAEPGAVRVALERLGGVRASGGTEMQSALREALRPLREDAQRQVVLLTDGYIGFEEEVIAEAARALPAGVRIHAVGVGAAPNRTLTGGLTRAGRGRELFAGDEETAEESARLLQSATAAPVLTEITVAGSAVREAAPARPLDVFAGRPALLTVELAPAGGRLEMTGRRAGRREAWRWSREMPAARAASSPAEGAISRTLLPLGAFHGRELVADLELEAAAGANRREINRRIEARALRHRIVSRCTSLVAVAEHPSVDPRAPRRRERLATELPAGISAEGAGLFPVAADHVVGERRVRSARAAEVDLMRSPAAYDDDVDRLIDGMEADLFDEAADQPGEERSADAWFADERPFAYRAHGKRPRGRDDDRAPRARDAEPVRVTADVLHHTPEILIVELEVPYDGFALPGGIVRVRLDDRAGEGRGATGPGPEVEAEVVPEESTSPGRYPAGVRVRLALRVRGRGEGHAGWHGVGPLPERVVLAWTPPAA